MMRREYKKPVHWTKKILKIKDLGDEPEMNQEGFWKKYESPKIKVKHG